MADYFCFTNRKSYDYYIYLITKAYHFKGAVLREKGLPQYGTDQDTHNKVLELLFLTPFRIVNERDKNRVAHALSARAEWLRNEYFHSTPEVKMEARIKNDPMYQYEPSCLEVLFTLAERLEEQFTSESGIRQMEITASWFWGMLCNIGLAELGDDVYDPEKAIDILNRWLDLRYEPDGVGGCFYLPGHGDVREVEIWYQAQWYYADLLKGVKDRGKY